MKSVISSILAALALVALAAPVQPLNIQEDFDTLGPTVRKLELANGKTLNYIDHGDPDGTPVVFVGGSGTSVRVFVLLEFLRSLREDLGFRIISAERNGLGETAFDPASGYGDYAAEVEELLDHLGVERFVAMAISGGGPYLTEVVSLMPERVISVHLAAAFSEFQGPDDGAFGFLCPLSDADLEAALVPFVENPKLWFGFAPDSPIHGITGFQDQAYEDAARTFFVEGQLGDPVPLTHEFRLFCDQPAADVSAVGAPTFLYYGEVDTSVTLAHAEFYEGHYPNIAKVRIYEDEGHDVQYRHWDQILVDMAGQEDKTVICHNRNSLLLPDASAQSLLDGGATLGICAWQDNGD